MSAATVYYLQKLDNPPYYNAGQELHTIEYHRGWVEYLNTTSNIYYANGLQSELYQQLINYAVEKLTRSYLLKDSAVLGLIHQLSLVRLEQPFELPMSIWIHSTGCPEIACGATRFTASVICGVDPATMPVIFQVNKNQDSDMLNYAQLITNTAEINCVAGLKDKEFTMAFTQTAVPHIMNMALRNTPYDIQAQSNIFEMTGNYIIDFWNQFVTNGKINLIVSCSDSTRQLIKFSKDIWNVEFCELDHKSFGFGKILKRFGETSNGQLNLFVYDIAKEFNLEYLIPWTHPKNVWYHTKNKKVHLFTTAKGPASATWPIVPMGNFV